METIQRRRVEEVKSKEKTTINEDKKEINGRKIRKIV